MQKDLSVSEVLTTIQHGALQWPKERLRVSNSSFLKCIMHINFILNCLRDCDVEVHDSSASAENVGGTDMR